MFYYYSPTVCAHLISGEWHYSERKISLATLVILIRLSDLYRTLLSETIEFLIKLYYYTRLV